MGKYALYTRPQDGFIDTGNGGGIGWALVDDICHAEVHDEVIINKREYHTIKEVKNGEGPHPIKTEKGWFDILLMGFVVVLPDCAMCSIFT